ncbi:MAG: 3-isopropylmalate dehydratase small subunit [Chloroflexi bacterium]|nr:3-isopropylmalate dehydratase small subunit [Chloroflexota bacterium]MCI0576784.1 3-isopropylmalate dehydratase small subunit [Chloroflexota bacterium]MCI0645340.1 3-isopropylmalate dehydratase small subunit [Chloroflexota bacterium]MCI0725112.1 3-isopropylmalate dehydratase small subunit [Chloroflexota bacterium]
MEPFRQLISHVVPLPYNDVDTDQIIPANYLKVTTRDGLVDGLFARWRYRPDGSLNPDFPLNRPEHQGARILLAGDNFGCGSSREHAPWALAGWGFQAVISTSFADIFCNNALKNGLLPVVVDVTTQQQLFSLVAEEPDVDVTIDLASQTLTLPDGRRVTFPIDAFSKTCLLEGIDQLGYLLKHEVAIAAYEQGNVK